MGRAAMALSVLLAGCASEDGSMRPSNGVPASCSGPPPCVYVTPDPTRTPPNALLTFHGRGWRPGRRVRATYNGPCDPQQPVCFSPANAESVTPRPDGSFELRLRPPRRAPAEPSQVIFRQGGARVDPAPLPGSASAADLEDARAMAAAVTRLEDAIRRRTPNRSPGSDTSSGKCEAILNRKNSSAVSRVIGSGLQSSEEQLRPFEPDMRRFSAELASVRPEDAVLRAGVEAWSQQLRRPREHFRPDFCTALVRWRAEGFAPARRPVDPEVPGLLDDLRGDPRLAAAALRMRALGVDQHASELFAEDEGGVLNGILLHG